MKTKTLTNMIAAALTFLACSMSHAELVRIKGYYAKYMSGSVKLEIVDNETQKVLASTKGTGRNILIDSIVETDKPYLNLGLKITYRDLFTTTNFLTNVSLGNEMTVQSLSFNIEDVVVRREIRSSNLVDYELLQSIDGSTTQTLRVSQEYLETIQSNKYYTLRYSLSAERLNKK